MTAVEATIEITANPIKADAVLQTVISPLAGASVLFVGTTRQLTAGRETVELEYECYAEMAIKKLQQLSSRAIENWNLYGCSIVHRIGVVPVGQASLAIAVSSAHRRAALEAIEWIVERLKIDVPIWKRECYADGETEWIHPS